MDFIHQGLSFCEKLYPYFENLIFYQFLSILVENCPNSADTLFLDPLATPPYESEVSRKNFIGSENGFEEFTENFKSIR